MTAATCERCHSPLRDEVAYCDECGLRTPRARRLVWMTVRIEVVVVVLILLLIGGFVAAYLR